MNIIGFWMALGIAALITLVKLVRHEINQDGNLPRFMMSRASNASWTGMPNSVMILVSLTVAPSWVRKFPEKNKLSD